MEFLEEIKKIGLIDIVVLTMLDMGYSASEIASKANLGRQTIYDIKQRNAKLVGLLNEPKVS